MFVIRFGALLIAGLVLLAPTVTRPAEAQNLASNPEFDVNLDGWHFLGPGGINVDVWSTRDWRESAVQGSAQITNWGDATSMGQRAGPFQCVVFPPSATLLRFGAWVDLPRGQEPAAGFRQPFLSFWTGSTCFTGSALGSVVPSTRGLPLNRPWVWHESTFPIPLGAVSVDVRLATIKTAGDETAPLVTFYDGVVLEPVEEIRDLSVLIRLRGSVTSVLDQDAVLDPSIIVGAPIVFDFIYDEAVLSNNPVGGTFDFSVPPGRAAAHIGASVFSTSESSIGLRAVLVDGVSEDQLILRPFEPFAAPANVNVIAMSATLVDATGTMIPDPPRIEDIALAEVFDDTRTFFLQGTSTLPSAGGINIGGVFNSVQVTPLVVFTDGFESGDVTSWSTTVP